MGNQFLLVIDAHTKWLDVHITTTTSTVATVEALRKSFSTFGLPEVVVSDNATGFKSEDFEALMQANGVKHVCTPPYHPSLNGSVERVVQTLKGGLKKLQAGSLETKLSRFLFSYRSSPHSSTGVSPAELMFGRRLHSTIYVQTSRRKCIKNRNVKRVSMTNMLNHESSNWKMLFMLGTMDPETSGWLVKLVELSALLCLK